MPIPLEGQDLIIDPSYPFEVLYRKEAEPVPAGVVERNTFWSRRLRAHVVIWEEEGKICGGAVASKQIDQMLSTLGASYAWGIEQEKRALDLLGTLIRHNMFKAYLLTGMFLETSPRSGITYVFRRLRPTVALKDTGTWSWKRPGINHRDKMTVLTTLCLHPIGYYEESWAGAMCPTDDVIAHLILMRGDEAMFWRRSNQHGADRPEAGL